MYNTVQALENWDMGPVSQKPRNFLRLFVATIPFISLQCRGSLFWAIKLRSPLGFSYIKNTLKDQLSKQADSVFGPEKFLELSRNRPPVFLLSYGPMCVCQQEKISFIV